MYGSSPLLIGSILAASILCPPPQAIAAPPGEVTGVSFSDRVSLTWTATPGAAVYHVYRRSLADPAFGCHGFRVPATDFTTEPEPAPGDAFLYLVTAESLAGEEGTQGVASNLEPRPLLGRCEANLRTHVLNRIGFGWSEWARDRIETVGLGGYIAQQLSPSSVSELTNSELTSRLLPITEPETLIELIQHQVIRAVYARRQLEQQYATFWGNHFNTDWNKVETYYETVFPKCDAPDDPPGCDPLFPKLAYLEASRGQYRELEAFRSIAFNGNFREIVEASALSPAMIIYLDTITSFAGAPNENYPRELMELHTLGVTGGYTQTDVEQLSRVITGWGVCKKAPTEASDPVAPCIQDLDPDVPGEFAANFEPANHDCTAKTLFAGTPQEVQFGNTCATPFLGLQELYTALDAVASHPATPVYVATKILQRFVTDEPTPEMIGTLVDEWMDAGNPHGVGDLRQVLAAALSLPEVLDPNRLRTKIKTPLEHAASALRATRGQTDGQQVVIAFLSAAQHVPHGNPTPTGWPEDGPSWIGTNNMLDRQNLGIELMASADTSFRADPIALLQANGVSTAPGNAAAIVDFFIDVLFGGAVTPYERAAAIAFLETDDSDVPSPYDDGRIRDTVAYLLGYAQFQEE